MERTGARLELALEFDGRRTRPRRALATPPLQLSRARYDDLAAPARLSLTLIHLGGILAGDCSELAVDVATGADAVVSAAAATQIHTMIGAPAREQTVIRAAADSALLWMPGAQILFAGAQFYQQKRVELAPGAFVALTDLLVPGRLARGEQWRFARYESTVEVVDQRGALLACEHTTIEPARRSPTAPGVMDSFAALGTLWLLGLDLDAPALARAAGTCGAAIGAAVLPGGCGVAVRALGAGLTSVHQALWRCYRVLAAEGLVPRGPGAD